MSRGSLGRTAAAVAVFGVATAWMTRPFLWKAADHLVETCDSFLNLWILAWDVHALGAAPGHLFHANIFYPSRYTLALSEHMLGNLPIFAPVVAVSGNPVLGLNAVILASFVLSGATMSILAHYWTRRLGPSLVAGFIYAFVPFRITQLAHMQLLSLEWLPLAVYFGDRLLREGGARAWTGFTAFTLWQCLVSYYLAYITVVVLGSYLVVLAWRLRGAVDARRLATVALALATVAVVMVPLTRPYQRLQRQGDLPRLNSEEFVRQHEDSVFLADPIWSYLSIPRDGHSVYHRLLTFQSKRLGWEKMLFPGFLPPAIALAGLVVARRRGAGDRIARDAAWPLAAALVASYVFSLGPWLTWNDTATWIRLPAYWVAQVVPGFSGIRAWTRFSFGVTFGLAGLTAIALARLTAGMGRAGRIVVAGLVLVGVALEYDVAPLALAEAPPRATPADAWLAAHGEHGALLVLPGVDIHGCKHAEYMYHTTVHWLPLATGYSGYAPRGAGWINPIARDLPDPAAIERARRRGIRWILLKRDRVPPEQRAAFADAVSGGRLVPAAAFGDDVVFDLTDGAPDRTAGPP